MNKLYLNAQGEYLVVTETSSHSSKKKHSAYWSRDINKAYVGDDIVEGRFRKEWKGVDPTGLIVAALPATATTVRKVVIEVGKLPNE